MPARFQARNPLSSFEVVHTRDPEEMRHALFSVYPSARSFEATGAEPFDGRGHDRKLLHSAVSYGAYGATVRMSFDESPFLRQQFCLGGTGETIAGSIPLAIGPHGSCVIPSDVKTRITFAAGYRQIVVRFDIDALGRKLAALIGARPSGALVFEPFSDPGSGHSQWLRRTVFFVAEELEAIGAAAPGPVLVELEQLVMLYLLIGGRHNHRHLLERNSEDIAPWQLRRAEDYIAEHIHRPITVEAIAAATGVSVRSVFKSFRAARGCSPMAFVKQRRLERAHDMLGTPDESTTVTGVALACGFQSLGHFAKSYRDHFGELPSDTLNREASLLRRKPPEA